MVIAKSILWPLIVAGVNSLKRLLFSSHLTNSFRLFISWRCDESWSLSIERTGQQPLRRFWLFFFGVFWHLIGIFNLTSILQDVEHFEIGEVLRCEFWSLSSLFIYLFFLKIYLWSNVYLRLPMINVVTLCQFSLVLFELRLLIVFIPRASVLFTFGIFLLSS